MANPASSIDPNSGFCSANSIYYSLRANLSLPSPSLPLSIYSYVLSILPTPPSSSPPPPPHHHHPSPFPFSSPRYPPSPPLSAPIFASPRATSCSSSPPPPSRSPSSTLLSCRSAPSYPLPTLSALPTRSPTSSLRLTNPSIAFTTSSSASKLPHHLTVVLLDSPLFRSFLEPGSPSLPPIETNQHDPAAILYSSGTTGRVKGVVISHRNLIALIAGYLASLVAKPLENGPAVTLFTIPLFHVFGFFMVIRSVALCDTSVLMEKVDLPAILRAVQALRVRFIPVSPPLVLALAKSDLVPKFDLSSLERVGCGGAPLGQELVELFSARFPSVIIHQGYGLTESSGSAATQLDPEEWRVFGSTGKLSAGLEAKIVDPSTGEALPPGRQGKLWLRGPTIMKGYCSWFEACQEMSSEFVNGGQQWSGISLHILCSTHCLSPSLNLNYGLIEGTKVAKANNIEDNLIQKSIVVVVVVVVVVILFHPEPHYKELESYLCRTNSKSSDFSTRAGYIGDDEATASTLDSEGWLKTGDLCYFDENGFLFIVDRLKELIKYKAYQVPPAELEQILQSHPEIADAAAIPYPDEVAGQIPMAFVVRQPGSSITDNQIMDFVAKQVSPYKKIRRVAFISSIPKSAAGKILRRELVNYALSPATSKL
ncbi:putative AMP-dependent synthetase/ligase, AMP-binding, AMP-binding enzyme domain, ANL [Dioscorea sansibarensis]